MLSAPSTPLLACDPALPDRDAHLDNGWVCERFGALSPGLSASTGRSAIAVEPDRLVRAKYRIGESLRVVHRLRVDGEPVTVTIRLFPGGSAGAARRSPTAIHDAEHDALWWVFPDDRRLRGIAAVMSASQRLAEQLGVVGWARSEVAEYAPERSLTVRAADASGRAVAYVKLYAPGTVDVARFAARYGHVARAFATDPATSVPTVLGTTKDLLAISPMAGTARSRPAGSADDADRVLAHLGTAIGRVHATPVASVAGIVGSFGRLSARRVTHSAELVAAARPALAEDLRRIADRLAAGPPADDELVLLHGDCHPKNTLVDGDRLALIDLDQAGLGAPACDIASLLARLAHGTVLGETTPDEARRLGDAFLAGYTAVRPLPSAASMRWHLAAALVAERAIRAVNRVNLRALASLDDLVMLAVAESAAVGTPPVPRERDGGTR